MSRPPIRVRLVRGRMLPIPPDDSVDGDMVITPEHEIRVRDSSWARRRIAREDLELVVERPMTMATSAPEPQPSPQHEPENIVEATPLIDLDLGTIPDPEK